VIPGDVAIFSPSRKPEFRFDALLGDFKPFNFFFACLAEASAKAGVFVLSPVLSETLSKTLRFSKGRRRLSV
jgi:hypothetical protein